MASVAARNWCSRTSSSLPCGMWMGTMWPAPSRLKAIMPGPLASVTNTCMPAIIRFRAPETAFSPILTLGCFQSRMWCSK